MRRENAALSAKELTVFKNDHSQHVLTFLKSAGRDEVLVILNFSSQPVKLNITLPAQYHIPEWQNLLNTGITKYGQELANIGLKPYEVSLWKREIGRRVPRLVGEYRDDRKRSGRFNTSGKCRTTQRPVTHLSLPSLIHQGGH